MFERFTKDARLAVVHAQEEARELRCSSIGPEHVALGVLAAGGPAVRALRDAGADPEAVADALRQVATGALDGEALASLGIDLEAVSRSADAVFGAGALERAGRRGRRRRAGGHIPFTGGAKKALELALREALRLNDHEIADRHVLLGVLRGGGAAGDILAGADRAAVRTALEARPDAA